MRTRLAVAFLGLLIVMAITAMITTHANAAVYDGQFCAPASRDCGGDPPAGNTHACGEIPCGQNCQTCGGQFDQSIRVCYAVKRSSPPIKHCALVEGWVPCGNLTSETCRLVPDSTHLCYCPLGGPVVGPCTYQQCEGDVP